MVGQRKIFYQCYLTEVGNSTEVRTEYFQSYEINTKLLEGKGHDICPLASNDSGEKKGVCLLIYKYLGK